MSTEPTAATARTWAIGDVHGCDRALQTILEVIDPQPDDTVVFLGDLVDRGPDTRQALERIIQLRQLCHVVTIMGNHDEMMRNAISGSGPQQAWLDAGGRETLQSYDQDIQRIPATQIRLLVEMVPYFENEDTIFVHATLEPDVSLRNQTSDYLRWKKLGGSEKPHPSGKRVVCGHTAQKDGVPLLLDGWVCLDTYAYGGKWLSALDTQSNQVFQASQTGESRTFPLQQYQ